ncbi:MDR family MFS transporter [Streptomonospora nanhaiensis]|uniref:MDR family MFS transporter n=1 Tax=Streptomonospora nanhaiensis TaxID=1323731 RepID=UPI001C9901C1|nr:MDR family MFS transporter [Streptomonospora nanhaiensis]MBX9389019.1 MFS transporter [Streptomonospora nanhaiensis]
MTETGRRGGTPPDPTASSAAPPGGGPEQARRLRPVFAGLLLGVMLGSLDQTIVATALPVIAGDLDGLSRLSWVVTSYILAATVVMPVYGKAGDLFGRKAALAGSLVLFLVGSGLAGAATDMVWLVVFRAVQGLGGGGLLIGAQALVGEAFPAAERGRRLGAVGAVIGLSAFAGPLVGGLLTDGLGWRWIFYVNLPVGAVALWLVLLAPRPRRPEGVRPRPDYPGAALIVVASGAAVLVATLAGGAPGLLDPALLAATAAMAAALALFVAAERRAADPLLPLRLFRDRDFTLVALVAVSVGAVMFGTAAYLPVFIQMVGEDSATASGVRLLPLVGGLLAGSVGAGRATSRPGRARWVLVAGAACSLAGVAVMAAMSRHSSYPLLAGGMLAVGLGVKSAIQTLVLIAQNTVRTADLGVATSTANYFRQMGACVGTAAMGAVFAGHLRAGLGDPEGAPPVSVDELTPQGLARFPEDVRAALITAFADAVPMAFLLLVPVAAAGLVLALFVRDRAAPSAGLPAGPDGAAAADRHVDPHG